MKMEINNFIMLFIIPALIECSAQSNTASEGKLEGKEEITLPNGTVVGKYSYTDNEGNPVQVKYFADDSSYGVELRSLKIVEGDANPSLQISKQSKFEFMSTEFPNAEPSNAGPAGPFDLNFPDNENKYKTPNNFFNKLHMGREEKTIDYDITKNYFKLPKSNMHGKGKLRIYNDKLHRKVREALSTFDKELPRICDQL